MERETKEVGREHGGKGVNQFRPRSDAKEVQDVRVSAHLWC